MPGIPALKRQVWEIPEFKLHSGFKMSLGSVRLSQKSGREKERKRKRPELCRQRHCITLPVTVTNKKPLKGKGFSSHFQVTVPCGGEDMAAGTEAADHIQSGSSDMNAGAQLAFSRTSVHEIVLPTFRVDPSTSVNSR